jgi:predicted nucleic acid-binding protein
MSASKATYLDSSALVKLAVREPESADDRMAAAANHSGLTVARPT